MNADSGPGNNSVGNFLCKSGQVTFFLWPSVSLIVKWRSWPIRGPVQFSLLSLWFSVDLKVAIFNVCLLFRWMKSSEFRIHPTHSLKQTLLSLFLNSNHFIGKMHSLGVLFVLFSFVLWSFLLWGHSYHEACLTMRTWVELWKSSARILCQSWLSP